jgi:hypothetical protein
MDLSYNIAANLPFQVGNTPMHGASSSTTEEINRRSSKNRKKSAKRSSKERKKAKASSDTENQKHAWTREQVFYLIDCYEAEIRATGSENGIKTSS